MAGPRHKKQEEIPESILAKWQSLVDILTKLLNVPVGLIMRINGPDIEVFSASKTEDNPYRPGQKEHLAGSGLYCETVINTRKKLLVKDALKDAKWKDNPDIKHHMLSYLGFPLCYPSGNVFGTLCILDNKPNAFLKDYEALMLQFKELIESHLALLALNDDLEHRNLELKAHLDEIKTLRGIIPICSFCKRIRQDEGYWQSVEQYMAEHTEASFTHGLCPECREHYYPGGKDRKS